MTPGTTHPLVAAYLEELDGLLAGIEPRERADVMLGVREHLDGALGATGGTDQEVREALAELGPPQLVANEAYAGRQPATAATPAAPCSSRVGTSKVDGRAASVSCGRYREGGFGAEFGGMRSC